MSKLSVCFLVGFTLIMQVTGCRTTVTTSDVSEHTPYKMLIGKHYVVLEDYYLVRIVGNSEPRLTRCGSYGLPQELDKNRIGDIINKDEIIGIVPKNSEFTLMKILQFDIHSNIHVVLLTPIISLSSQYNYVEASVLMKEYTQEFSFDSDLVKEVP